MDPTSVFFVKLRRMATTLESETAKLQRSFENRNNEEDSGESFNEKLIELTIYIYFIRLYGS